MTFLRVLCEIFGIYTFHEAVKANTSGKNKSVFSRIKQYHFGFLYL